MKNLDEDTLKEIGRRCLTIREDYNEDRILSQREFADKLDITHSRVSLIEAGQSEMTIKELHAYQQATGYSFDYFMGKAEAKKPDNEEIRKRLGLDDEAIEALDNLVKATKDEIGLKELAIDQIKTINYLIKKEKNYPIFRTVASFLWHTYRTDDFLGQEMVEVVDNSGYPHLIHVSDLYNVDILEIERQLNKLKENKDAEKDGKHNKDKYYNINNKTK